MGLDESKKELMITLAPKEFESDIHKKITEKMKLDKKGLGILFSADTSSVCGSRLFNRAFEEKGENMSEYQLLVSIVDRDSGDDVVAPPVKKALKVQPFFTVVEQDNWNPKLFNIEIQPERNRSVSSWAEKVHPVSESIRTAMDFDQPVWCCLSI